LNNNQKKSPIWLYLVIAVSIVLFFIFYSFLRRQFSPSTQNRGGNIVVDAADQYREISSLMIRRYLEGDYESLRNLLYEANNIIGNTEKLSVTPQYSVAKSLLLNWMYSDSLYYMKLLQNPSDKDLQSIFDMSSDYYLEFLKEMKMLGHDLR